MCDSPYSSILLQIIVQLSVIWSLLLNIFKSLFLVMNMQYNLIEAQQVLTSQDLTDPNHHPKPSLVVRAVRVTM